jgi:hypothetical protein
MTEEGFVSNLKALMEACEIPEDVCQVGVRWVRTFDEAGLVTRDYGLVVRMDDNSVFQVVVVRTRR